MKNTEENKICSWEELLGAFRPKKYVGDEYFQKMMFTGSGKAAIKIVLDYLKINGIIENKNSEILVPQWLGYWVYNMMHKTAFPCLTYNDKVKVMFVYHQYGFPQNMDEIMDFAERKRVIIIEDCAHVFESYYKGKRLGCFGLAAVFSFSKMFPIFVGGGITTGDQGLLSYATKQIDNNDSLVSFFALISKICAEKFSAKYFKYVEMSYGVYDRNTKMNWLALNLLLNDLRRDAIAKRRNNYSFLLNYFKRFEYFEGLENDVVPYVVPLMASEEQLGKIGGLLCQANIKTGIYHFDVNRNLLNPKFVKCVWVPVHQGLSINDMNRICDLIKKASV